MRTIAGSALGAVAIMAKHLKARREALLLQPRVKAITATTPDRVAWAFAIDMVKR